MEDITPSLLKVIQTDFQSKFDKSSVISSLYAKVRDGTATYVEANEFAIETGNILAQAFQNNLSSNVLPDGRMYYNIAQRILEPTMINNYELITEVTNQVQTSLNKSAGIGIKAITPELNEDKIVGIVNRVSDAETFDDVAWILDEPIKTFSQSIVDDSIKANAEFHSKAGLQPVITRKVAGNCCDWCKTVAGTYRYPNDVPHDVYRRHQRCRCTVDYIPGDGKFQNVHSKKWRTEKESNTIETRKTIGLSLQKHSGQEMYLKTGTMSAKEYAEFKRELNGVKGRKQIILPKDEYAMVMSELNTHMSDEDRKHAIVTKAIGNHYYTIINKGFDDYTIIAKRPIINDIEDAFDGGL